MPDDFPAENIRDWRDHDVVDVSGDKIGSLESVYFDTASDRAAFASIQVGLPGFRKLTFAPLIGAVVSPRYLKLTVDKKAVKDAPTIDTDGELTREQEPALYAHYGLPYVEGATGERRLGRR
jgi:hypothetical protein